jgi:hypothetical protein
LQQVKSSTDIYIVAYIEDESEKIGQCFGSW